MHVFELEGHPRATRAYAWSSPIEGSTSVGSMPSFMCRQSAQLRCRASRDRGDYREKRGAGDSNPQPPD